jgi:heterotetrameric sarcosine oxidase gamma subunit
VGDVIVPLARSPIAPAAPVVVLDGWEVSARLSSAALTLADVTASTKVLVKADANGAHAATALGFGRAVRHGGGHLEVGSSPGEWLHLAPVADAAGLLATLNDVAASASDDVAVFDVTHGRALMRLTGGAAPTVMAKICAIDLSDARAPDLRAFRSSVAKTVTDVVRDDVDGRRSYLLHCDRSFGQYLFDCVLDAGQEFGIDVAGSATGKEVA